MAKTAKKTKVRIRFGRPGVGKSDSSPMSPAKRQQEIEALMKKLKVAFLRFKNIKLADVEDAVVDYENLRAELETVLDNVSDVEKRAQRLLDADVPHGLYDAYDDLQNFQHQLSDVF
jgi:hypothetical protein